MFTKQGPKSRRRVRRETQPSRKQGWVGEDPKYRTNDRAKAKAAARRMIIRCG